MICQHCGEDFPESYIEESHDVPCYLFEGKYRNERKNQADKYPRHNLCKRCHKEYERSLKERFREISIAFSQWWFGDSI
jgi:hypothetical protein